MYTLSSTRLLAYASTIGLARGYGCGIVGSAQESWEETSTMEAARASPNSRTSTSNPSDGPSQPHSQPVQLHPRSRSQGFPPVPVSDTARRLGEGVMSGMKAISDYGYNRYMASGRASGKEMDAATSVSSRAFSKSAPQASHLSLSSKSDRQVSQTNLNLANHSFASQHKSSDKSSIMVIDLVATCRSHAAHHEREKPATLGPRSSASPLAGLAVVGHFRPSQHNLITLLSFNPAGTHILTSSVQGHSFHIFELRPFSPVGSSPARFSSSSRPIASAQKDIRVWHRYRLNRGLTVASAVGATWSDDSRFVAVTTTRGTAHVFAVNPIGGKVGINTHLRENAGNLNALQPLSITVNAIARVKAPRSLPEHLDGEARSVAAEDEEKPGLLARIVESPSLLFMTSGEITEALRTPDQGAPVSFSPHFVCFYPHLGNLVNSRLSLSASPAIAPPTAPLSSQITSQAVSGLTQMMRSGGSIPTSLQGDQLLARESKVAYYPLRRVDQAEETRIDLFKLYSEKPIMLSAYVS